MGSVLSQPPSQHRLQEHLELFWGSSVGDTEAFLLSGCADRAGGGTTAPPQFELCPSIHLLLVPSCPFPRSCSDEAGRRSVTKFRPSTGSVLLRGGVRGPVRCLPGPSAAAASSALPTELPGARISSGQPIRGQKDAHACCQSSPQKTRLTSCCLRRLLTTSSFFKMATLTLGSRKKRGRF